MLGNKLKKGDTIGILAPDNIKYKKILSNKIKLLNNLGFKCKLAKHIFNRKDFLNNKIKYNIKFLMNMFCDKNINAILCINSIFNDPDAISIIDWNIIKSNPKIFIGYSQITYLLNELFKRCNLISFYEPIIFSNSQNKQTINSFLNAIENVKPYCIDSFETNIKSTNNSIIDGYLIGGNLSCIYNTINTEYELNVSNKILFLEDSKKDLTEIAKMLSELMDKGKLDNCRGLILGSFNNNNIHSEKNILLEQFIEQKLSRINKPIMFNFPCGCTNPNVTLPIGSKIRLNCAKNKIQILNNTLKE